MMKKKINKIKRLEDIQAAEKDLRLQEMENREKIRRAWKDLKAHPHWEDLLKTHGTSPEGQGSNFVVNKLKQGAGWLSGKLVEKAAERMAGFVKKKKQN